jgi:hypothetical protein
MRAKGDEGIIYRCGNGQKSTILFPSDVSSCFYGSDRLGNSPITQSWIGYPNVANLLRGKTCQSLPDVAARRLGEDEAYLIRT